MQNNLFAGAAVVDSSPKDSQFLYGYPHVERYSTGIHDPLFSSALYLSDGQTKIMFIANDIIFVSKEMTAYVRNQINEHTGIPAQNILISATHTHSGPITVNYVSNSSDPVVPKADIEYIRYLTECMIEAALKAFSRAQPARVGLGLADSTGVGTNRHDPQGLSNHQVPVLMVKSAKKEANIACMLVGSMHPTVLHEDSTLVSADFPGFARKYLQQQALGLECPVLYHTGPCGDQSPRHVTHGNTFSEAERLGNILGASVLKIISNIEYQSDISLQCFQREIDLPKKSFPNVQIAENQLKNAVEKLEQLRSDNAKWQDIRTAECDWFGAEETLTLAKAVEKQEINDYYKSCLPAEIQLLKIGPWNFFGWPGEIFTEYALLLKKKVENSFVISLANGELQGYITTQEAADNGWYEGSNALFHAKSGQLLVDESVKLFGQI